MDHRCQTFGIKRVHVFPCIFLPVSRDCFLLALCRVLANVPLGDMWPEPPSQRPGDQGSQLGSPAPLARN